MKTKDVKELYGILSGLKLTGMPTPAKMAILESIRTLKPFSNTYQADCDDAIRMLRPEGFDDIEAKANRHNEAVKAENDKGRLSPSDLQEVNEAYAAYFKEVEGRTKELGEADCGISPVKIDAACFDKLIEANDLPAGMLATLYENLV